jgi:ankyrin repeat protein
MHRRELFYSKCDKVFPAADVFRQHLTGRKHKSSKFTEDQLCCMTERGNRPIESKQKCPLCDEKHKPRQLQSHLGRHMEQIALFILPRASEEDVDVDDMDHDSDDDGDTADAIGGEQKKSTTAMQRARFLAEHFVITGGGVNAYDTDGYTPLHKAIRDGDSKSITLLLESGANPRAVIKDSTKSTVLMAACRNGKTEVVALLLAREDIHINIQDSLEDTALMEACWNGSKEVVELLLAREDINIDIQNKYGSTALMFACMSNDDNGEPVALLLARDDVDINARNNDGLMALAQTCSKGHREVVKVLLERDDLEVSSKDKNGQTALMWACETPSGRYLEVVKLLLGRKDIDIGAKSNKGKTAHDLASQRSRNDILELLDAFVKDRRE